MSDRARAMDMPAFERLTAQICMKAGWSLAGTHATWLRQALYAALAAARAEERAADIAAIESAAQDAVKTRGHVDNYAMGLLAAQAAIRARGTPPEGAGG